MTFHGLCHNSALPESTMSISSVKRLMPWCVRSITYWRNDKSVWRKTLQNMQQLAQLGVKNLVVFNTEASGCKLNDLDGQARRLSEFLNLSVSEYSYYDNTERAYRSPVHFEEPANELDMPGWDDGDGNPITPELCARIALAHHEVAQGVGVEVISPSFLGAPNSWLITGTARILSTDGRINKLVWHPYGKSIGNQPYPGGLFGDLWDGVNELMSYAGDMQLVISETGWWASDGQDQQARFVDEFCKFQHPRVHSMYYFAENDWCPFDAEYYNGRDFGLITRDGLYKESYYNFKGELFIDKPQPVDPEFVLGFQTLAHKLLLGGVDPGKPLENEWGPWPYLQQQRTSTGWFTWCDLKDIGGKLSFTTLDGRRFRWNGDMNSTYEEITRWQPRV